MHAPAPLPLGAAVSCARCKREPDNVDALEAFNAGHTGDRRAFHGAPAFYVCAGCARAEALSVRRDGLAYWCGLGATPAQAAAMLGPRPA